MDGSDRWPGGELYLPSSEGWTRRRLLGTALGIAAVAVGGGLVGCSSESGSSSSQSSSGTPKKGGRLTFGASGGLDSDTLDGQAALQPTDFARSYALFDGLVRLDNSGKPRLWLAESITPNSDATEWTITIPSGVTTHRGKTFTSSDVLFSLRRMVENQTFGASALGPIDLGNSQLVDETTLRVRYSRPFSILPDALSIVWCVMVPEGFDPQEPDGTGPFMYQSFTPGETSTFVRNDNYWASDGPYLDELVIDNIDDETAQVNALQSGQVNVVNALSASSAAVLRGAGFPVHVSQAGACGLFSMRADVAPFSDVKVRQALRLIVDRGQMAEQLFGGEGTVGNDVYGLVDPSYDKSLPQREQDLDEARSLLRSAGQSDLQLEIVTAPFGPSLVQAAEVFVTQAQEAGIDARVTTQTVTDYFATSWKNVPFTQDFWFPVPYLTVTGLSLAGESAPFNVSHFNDPEYNDLYEQAVSTVEDDRRTDLAHQMQEIEYERGSLIIPYYMPGIDATAPNVRGIEPTATALNPGGLYWADVWIDS